MTPTTTHGYVEDDHGYTMTFSWWRNNLDRRIYSVVNHTGFGSGKVMTAVSDDFGNLVEVAQ